MAKELKNKPLVEAILEIRWKLRGASPGPQTDPHYKLLRNYSAYFEILRVSTT